MEWNPIETAPNDEAILVFYSDKSVRLIEADDNDYDWQPFNAKTAKWACCPVKWAAIVPPSDETPR